MTKTVLSLLVALRLFAAAHVTQAQANPITSGLFTQIPLKDPVYQDAATLWAFGFKDFGGLAGSHYVEAYGGTFTGTLIKTPYEYAAVITRFLNDTDRETSYDIRLSENPEALAAFDRLFQRFEPFIAKLSVNIPAAQSRLAMLGHPFPDVPMNHWAFQSAETLRKAGIIIGYPAKTSSAK